MSINNLIANDFWYKKQNLVLQDSFNLFVLLVGFLWSLDHFFITQENKVGENQYWLYKDFPALD